MTISKRSSLDKLISSVPSEMLYEIFINLPFKELINIFTLNREIYHLLMESEYFFEKLCNIYCKIHDIELSDYGKAVQSVKESRIENKNLYFSVMVELITSYGYSWDTGFAYYKNENKFEMTTCTLKTLDKPQHGDFYTVKANKLMNPGRFYKWKIKLDDYKPENVGNGFKIMIGIESLGFFPFNKQQSGDVIGWQGESKGVALITGSQEIIQAACKSSSTSFKFKQDFLTGDIIQIEFDYKGVPLDVEPFKHTGTYSSELTETKYMGAVRFCHIRNGQLTELRGWAPFGDVRFAPFVPAVSVNKGQTISIVH